MEYPRRPWSLFGPSNNLMQRYEEELIEWQAICDDMTAAERVALQNYDPGICELCQYWMQQCIGLTLEMPLRICYHSCCVTCSFACCLPEHPSVPPSLACDPEHNVWKHHAHAVQEQWWLAQLLIQNLIRQPCTPWYVYQVEVSLVRPDKPKPPKGWCDDCCQCKPKEEEQCCDASCDVDCNCERLLYHVNRRLRSLLCTYSGVSSCHPTHCLGPCPCFAIVDEPSAAEEEPATDAQQTSGFRGPYNRLGKDADASDAAANPEPCCVCCVLESAVARHKRWDDEFAEARQRRTEAFYARRAAVAKGEPVPQETPYVKLKEEVPTGLEAPTAIDAESYRCERLQGRLAACALCGCCCAGAVGCVHLVCGAFAAPVPAAAGLMTTV